MFRRNVLCSCVLNSVIQLACACTLSATPSVHSTTASRQSLGTAGRERHTAHAHTTDGLEDSGVGRALGLRDAAAQFGEFRTDGCDDLDRWRSDPNTAVRATLEPNLSETWPYHTILVIQTRTQACRIWIDECERLSLGGVNATAGISRSQGSIEARCDQKEYVLSGSFYELLLEKNGSTVMRLSFAGELWITMGFSPVNPRP